ncbi:hypothetical protein BKA62DRAFT_761463, partial [Auriculariales sp. MPI-PUGE-AT-0066]
MAIQVKRYKRRSQKHALPISKNVYDMERELILVMGATDSGRVSRSKSDREWRSKLTAMKDSGTSQLDLGGEDLVFEAYDDALEHLPSLKRTVSHFQPEERVSLFENWHTTLPLLVRPYQLFVSGSSRDRPAPEGCADAAACKQRRHKVVCVFWNRNEIKSYSSCIHMPLAVRLLYDGLFPSGPTNAGYAYCINLLAYNCNISRHTGGSATGLARALHDFHRFCGQVLVNHEGFPIQEGYHRTFQHAIQWYQILVALVQDSVARLLNAPPPFSHEHPKASPGPETPASNKVSAFSAKSNACDTSLQRTYGSSLFSKPGDPIPPTFRPLLKPAEHEFASGTTSLANAAATAGDRARRVSTRPKAKACAGTGVTRPLGDSMALDAGCFLAGHSARRACRAMRSSPERMPLLLRGSPRGGDFHFALDGNFGQKHNARAGDCPPIKPYSFRYFIPDVFVSAVDVALKTAGQRPPREYHGAVPQEVIDECKDMHTAADGSRVKAGGDKHDDRGLMAVVCRHDIPLYVCNIDTPGEQSKYAVALIIWLMIHLPDLTTAVGLYDIACVTSRTLGLYGILGPSLDARITLCTAAMHSYVHMWTCQMHFAPRFRRGLGLTDGEGVERLWARICKLIPILRHVFRHRRLVILDSQLTSIGYTLRDDLGRWISRRYKLTDVKEAYALKKLRTIPHSIEVLRVQWQRQQEAQVSVRKKKAADTRREIQDVATVQDKMHSVQRAILRVERSVKLGANKANRSLRMRLRGLRESERKLEAEAQELYNELCLPTGSLDLIGMARNSCASLSCFMTLVDLCNNVSLDAFSNMNGSTRPLVAQEESWVLNRYHLRSLFAHADRPLTGTKEHQAVLSGMAKRTPALKTAIAHHNAIITELRHILLDTRMEYPLPELLPSEISKLKTTHADALLQDVIVLQPGQALEVWMTDPTIRLGIRYINALDRCREERARLKQEERNLHHMVKRSSTQIRAAMQDQQSALAFITADVDEHFPDVLQVPFLQQELARLGDIVSGCRGGLIAINHWHDALGDVQYRATSDEPANMATSTLKRDLNAVSAPKFHQCDLDIGLQVDLDDDGLYNDLSDESEAGEDSAAIDLLLELQGPEATPDPAEMEPTISIKQFSEPVEADTRLREQVLAFKTSRHSQVITQDLKHDAQNDLNAPQVSIRHLQALIQGDMISDTVVYSALACMTATTASAYRHTYAVFDPLVYQAWVEGTYSMAEIFNMARGTQFWEVEVILLPVFFESHWMAAVIGPQAGCIEFFDSLSDQNNLELHGSLVAHMILSLMQEASKEFTVDVASPPEWTVIQLLKSRCQSNLVDCGLWTIAALAAAMHGFSHPALIEADMPAFRRYI